MVCNFKTRWEIFSNFVAFSQYLTFNHMIWKKVAIESSTDVFFRQFYSPNFEVGNHLGPKGINFHEIPHRGHEGTSQLSGIHLRLPKELECRHRYFLHWDLPHVGANVSPNSNFHFGPPDAEHIDRMSQSYNWCSYQSQVHLAPHNQLKKIRYF